MKKWTTSLRRLILLSAIAGGGAVVWQTVTGASPLALVNALAKPIRSLTQFGKCVQDGTPTPSAPVDIVCNNGAVRFGALGDNLFDPNPPAITLGWYIASNNGVVTESQTNFMLSQFIPIEGDKKYVFYGRHKTSNRISSYNRIAWYSASKTFMTTANYPKDGIGTGTAPLNARYARLSCNLSGESAATGTPVTYEQIADYNWTFAQADAEIPYEPFVGGIYTDGTPEVLTVSASGAEPQTASVPMLLSVGDIKDEGEIISGGVTHRIGCHVFDGTETFSKSSAYGKAFLLNAAYAAWGADKTKAVLCTHFLGLPQKSSAQDDNTCFFNSTGHFYFRVTDNSDTDAFEAWLAAQYAAGTPVIVFFVLAEETTEQTTPHSLRTSDGDNLVSVTSEVDPVTLSVEYATSA